MPNLSTIEFVSIHKYVQIKAFVHSSTQRPELFFILC